MKPFELLSFADADALAQAAARDWMALLAKNPTSHLVALSGGRVAKNFFVAVANLAQNTSPGLSKVEFFWADERCVPPESPDSNFLEANKNLFQPLALPTEKIHRLKGELPPSEAVAEANAVIGSIAPRNSAEFPILDLIFLGLGEDGHIASLMPNASASEINSRAAYLHVANSPKPPPNRLSMSYGTIAAAREVWVLASGAGKEAALHESLRLGGATPLARVLQSRADTRIYSDISVIV